MVSVGGEGWAGGVTVVEDLPNKEFGHDVG